MVFPNTILPIKGEIFVNNAWTDITHKIYSRDSINIKRGRADEAATIEPSLLTCTLNNRNGAFSPRNPLGIYYGQIGRNTPFRLGVLSSSYMQLDVDTGSNATVVDIGVNTPDNAALDIAGDIMLTVDADLTSWREDAQLISKWNSNTGNRGYLMMIRQTGQLRVYFSPDGATSSFFDSTAPVPLATGRQSVRMTLDANNGGGCTVQFFTSDTLGGTYTQLGNTIFGPTAITIFNNNAPLVVTHAVNNIVTNALIRGRVYAAQVRDGISPGTIVANPDFTAQTDGATSFVDSAGRTWTISGTAFITTRDPRFTGELSSLPQAWDISDTDIYVPVEASGPLRRLSQGSAALHSTLYRGLTKLSGTSAPVAYWPMEDAAGSTRFASAISGKSGLGIGGGPPTLATYSGFPSSQPLPTLNLAAISGDVPKYTSTGVVQVRFVIAMPAAGSPTGVLFRLNTNGSANRWDIFYTAGFGGQIGLRAYNTATDPDTNLLTTSDFVFNTDGNLLRFSLQLNNSGSDVVYAVNTAQLNVGGLGGLSGTLTGKQIGAATHVTINPSKIFDDVAVGHLTVQKVITSNSDMNAQLDAYLGETAGRRIQRLCSEEGVTFQGDGDLDDTVPLGTQLPLSLLSLIQESADADLGLLYETRDRYGLGYRPRTALYKQTPDLTLNYALHQMTALVPVEDDQNTKNDITVSRASGSSSRAVLTTGRLSTASPSATPPGIGVYDDNRTVNVSSDDALDEQAGWRLRLGTVDEARYPTIQTNLAAAAFASNPALSAAAASCDIGSRIAVTNPPSWLPPEAISELVQGTAETLSQYERTITFNTSPNVPYDTVGVYDSTLARYSPDSSVVALGFNSSAASFTATTTPVWSFADGAFDIMVGGERMTVTSITGTSNPQTLGVTRAVNGIVKAHSANEAIELYPPAYYAY